LLTVCAFGAKLLDRFVEDDLPLNERSARFCV
jgi:hypothetical protein